MSKELVIMLEPFDWLVWMYVYENGVEVDRANAVMPDVPEMALNFAKSAKVENISIRGPVDFTSKMKERIETKDKMQYGYLTMNIVLV